MTPDGLRTGGRGLALGGGAETPALQPAASTTTSDPDGALYLGDQQVCYYNNALTFTRSKGSSC